MSVRRRRSRYYEPDPPGPKCSYCQRPLALLLGYVRCALCSQLHFCADCFSVGANLRKEHDQKHPYSVVERVDTPVFAELWSAEDEEKLLDALCKYGLHNWRLVANDVGTHSAKRCEEHYYAVYIDHKNAPLPRELPATQSNGDETTLPAIETPTSTPRRSIKRRRTNKLPGEEEDDARDSGIEKETTRATRTKVRSGNGHELIGYLPKRGDFEVEFDDEAEHLIADLEISEGDDEATFELKAQLIELYDERLREREAVKKLVVEHKLDYVKGSVQSLEKNRQAQHIIECLRDGQRSTRKRARRRTQHVLSPDASTPDGMDD